ncbi:GNAT family N-acetyltransferase [Streptomyces sp. NPDC050704]|uniref:GNAT family N-acetyltransferase n=1 Tax=Streptomyces sp. NPDC050704 TaxID=3157219 RepID=UPI003449EBD2
MKTHLHDSAARLTAPQWAALYGTRHADRGHGYALFREHMEPGAPVLVAAEDDAGRCAALHGALTTAGSGLFSHPWKLLTSEQLLRPEEPGADRARADRERLLTAVTGTAAQPDAAALTTALGEAVVFRSFDSTEAGLREGLTTEARHAALRALLAAAQDAVRDGLAGAVCLPFVRRDDLPLRTGLAELGFRQAALTAVSDFDLTGVSSYEEFLASLPSRRRRMYRKEGQAVADSPLTLGTWSLTGHVKSVAALEARNIAKHGGQPDPVALVAARSAMAELIGDRVRVPVVLRADEADEPAACGIHLTDDDSYCILMYGADETVPAGGPVYAHLTFYEPLRHAADHGLSRVRLGFEAFDAKLRRGASLSPRETWLWLPDAARLDTLHQVMQLLGTRTEAHFARLTGQPA